MEESTAFGDASPRFDAGTIVEQAHRGVFFCICPTPSYDTTARYHYHYVAQCNDGKFLLDIVESDRRYIPLSVVAHEWLASLGLGLSPVGNYGHAECAGQLHLLGRGQR